jgi:hypothetical protein
VRARGGLPGDRRGLRPDHVTIARFRARHQEALAGLFSQVLRLLAASPEWADLVPSFPRAG